ncbi:MAG: ABC transporter ATP-binding protein [Desulfatiglandaceae bacterium]
MAFLEVENVTAGYGNGPDILKGLSLEIEQEKIYCLIGPNGAGKSTLLRAICGLLHPREGRVVFKGETINRLRTEEILRKGISFVPQDRSLFPDMSVKENLRMGGYILKNRRELKGRIEKVFRMFPVLRERSNQQAKTLSGGEQQMLATGRSLVLRPTVMMLDEPSLGLAPKVAKWIFKSINQLNNEGVTIILVEQNARKGLECADWGCVLDLGKNRFEGPAKKILDNPRIQELYLGRKLQDRQEDTQ